MTEFDFWFEFLFFFLILLYSKRASVGVLWAFRTWDLMERWDGVLGITDGWTDDT